MNTNKFQEPSDPYKDVKQFPLILREVAAIGIRLSHASLLAIEANCSVTRR